jgi:hypothetical protein
LRHAGGDKRCSEKNADAARQRSDDVQRDALLRKCVREITAYETRSARRDQNGISSSQESRARRDRRRARGGDRLTLLIERGLSTLLDQCS